LDNNKYKYRKSIEYNMFAKYNSLLIKYPIRTKSISAFFVYNIGDGLTQTIFDWANHK
jgi:hypothetical protein